MAELVCEVYYLLRIHGKDTDKTVTVKSDTDTVGQLLLGVFPSSGKATELHKLIHRVFTPQPSAKVTYDAAKPKPDEGDVRETAISLVKGITNTPVYDVIGLGLPSLWNPNTRHWDTPPGGTNWVAYGFTIRKINALKPIEEYIAVDSQTLWVNVVVQLQGLVV